MDREAEYRRQALERANIMIGRIEIPEWTEQDFEKWAQNDRATEETIYCIVMESLKKNYTIKGFVIHQVIKRTDHIRIRALWM